MRTNEAATRLPFIPEGEQVTSLEAKANQAISQPSSPQEILTQSRESFKLDENAFYNGMDEEDFLEVGDGGYGWVVVLCSFCCLTFVDGFGTSYSLLLNPKCNGDELPCIGSSVLADDLGVNTRTLMLLPHGFLLGLNLFVGPFVSAISSVVSFRYVAMFGAFLVAISCFLASVSWNFYLFLILTIFIGIGSGFIYLPAIAIVGQWFQTRRSIAVGITLCGVGVGELIGGLLMTRLTENYGWRFILLIMSCCAFQLMIISALFRPIEIHGVIENVQSIKRREAAERRRVQLEEKARKAEAANAEKLAKKQLKKTKEDLSNRRSQTPANKSVNNRGTIMQKIIEEKNRQRTTSVGSLDGMFINQDNELIAHPNPEKCFNIIAKISESALISLENRFGFRNFQYTNDNNVTDSGKDPSQDMYVSKVLVNAVNSENKLISIHVPDEPIPMKVPLDKLVQEYVQSQMALQANKSNFLKSHQSSDKNSVDILNRKSHQESSNPETKSCQSAVISEVEENIDKDATDQGELDVEVADNERSQKVESLANSLSGLNTPLASSPGLSEDQQDDSIQIESTGVIGKSIAAMAAEQVLDPETKAAIRTQVFQEIFIGNNNDMNPEATGLSRSLTGQLESINHNENVLKSILTSKINSGNCTSIKSSKSQKSQLQSSFIVSISTGMAGAPCPTKLLTKSRLATIDLEDENDMDEGSLLLSRNMQNISEKSVDEEITTNNQNMINEAIILAQHNEFESDPASMNFTSSMHRIPDQSSISFICVFLQDILNPKIFLSFKFVLLIISSFFGIFGLVLPILYIPDFINAQNYPSHFENRAGYLLSVIGCSNCVGRLIATIYIEKFNTCVNSTHVNTISLFVSGALILMIPLLSSDYLVLVSFFILFGIFSSIFMSLKNILVVELIGYEKLTNAFGYLLLTQGLGVISAAVVCGLTFDALNGQIDSIKIFPGLQDPYPRHNSTKYDFHQYTSPPSIVFFIAGASFILASLFSLPLIKMHRLSEKYHREQLDANTPSQSRRRISQETLRIAGTSEKKMSSCVETEKLPGALPHAHKHEDLDPVKEEDEETQVY